MRKWCSLLLSREEAEHVTEIGLRWDRKRADRLLEKRSFSDWINVVRNQSSCAAKQWNSFMLIPGRHRKAQWEALHLHFLFIMIQRNWRKKHDGKSEITNWRKKEMCGNFTFTRPRSTKANYSLWSTVCGAENWKKISEINSDSFHSLRVEEKSFDHRCKLCKHLCDVIKKIISHQSVILIKHFYSRLCMLFVASLFVSF